VNPVHEANRQYRLDLFLRNQSSNRTRLPDPVSRPVAWAPCDLPLLAAARRAEEAMRSLAIGQPVVVDPVALGAGFDDALFGCPQEALVTVPAPASETTPFQHTVAPPAM
jgi:hypothetical protein